MSAVEASLGNMAVLVAEGEYMKGSSSLYVLFVCLLLRTSISGEDLSSQVSWMLCGWHETQCIDFT